MSKVSKTLGWIIILAIAAGAIFIISAQYIFAVSDISILQSMADLSASSVNIKSSQKHPAIIAKGVYLTAYSAGSTKKINEIIKLLDKTELNAVVIDIKDYSGKVLYNSQVPLVKDLHLSDNRLGDVKKLIEKLHQHDIYVIARQTVFQDPILAAKKTEWAIKNKGGGVWRDNKGLAWVDPSVPDVWDYNIAITKEAANFGFDEINFDYVRFPSDGNMSSAVFKTNGLKKYEVMGNFYKYLSEQLSGSLVWISLDMFGFVMERTGTNDMNIGQRLADAVENTDYICPMMYPSHYPSGHLGLANPAAHPALVIENGVKKGIHYFQNTRAQFRPWIQAFNMGAVYGGTNIRAQIDAVEKYPNAGWLLWNASNRYTSAGLKDK